MPSANATPITGSELIRVLQGLQEVWLTRIEMNTLLALTEVASPRIFGTPTPFNGTETIRAVQGGMAIRLMPSDLSGYLTGTGKPDPKPYRFTPTGLTGAERIMGAQGIANMAFSKSEFQAINALGVPINALLSPIDSRVLLSPIDGRILLRAA